MICVCDRRQDGTIWADAAYRKKNEAFLAVGMFKSHIHQRPQAEAADARRSKIRAHVQHVFAEQKHRLGLVVRTIGIARAMIKIGMANLVYNFQWLEGRTVPVRPKSGPKGRPTTQKAGSIPTNRRCHANKPARLLHAEIRRFVEVSRFLRCAEMLTD